MQTSATRLYDARAHTFVHEHTHGTTNALGLRQAWFRRHVPKTDVWPRAMSNAAGDGEGGCCGPDGL